MLYLVSIEDGIGYHFVSTDFNEFEAEVIIILIMKIF